MYIMLIFDILCSPCKGSTDGTVRIWEVETGRCLRVFEIGEAIQDVAWNPSTELPVLAVVA